jgi:hypothetical protein
LKNTIQLVLSLVLALTASGQQVASVDLRRPAPVAEIPKTTDEPKGAGGCEKESVGRIADGFTQSDDGEPRPIRLVLTNLSSLNLKAGTEIEATVQLLNSGSKSIQIPWSTDWGTTFTGQDVNDRTWQVGEFRVELKGKQNWAELKELSQILFASTFVPGSSLTLKPREWISARINFIVEVAKPAYMEIDEGDAELSVRWFQTTRTLDEKDCRVSLGYFPFKSYEQENPAVSVHVEKDKPEEGKKAAGKLKSKCPAPT